MKNFLTWCATLVLTVAAQAQVPQLVTARDIKIEKISPAVTSSPQYNVSNTTDKPLTNAMIGNMWVNIKKQGQTLATKSASPGQPRNLPQFPGLLIPKSDTPFAPLWYDRYEAVRPNSR